MYVINVVVSCTGSLPALRPRGGGLVHETCARGWIPGIVFLMHFVALSTHY
jgi:hypothetical protein